MTSGTNFREKFAIVGLGMTKMGHMLGHSARALEAEAARLAIEDAGLKREDIDGCIHTRVDAGGVTYEWTDCFPRILGLPVKFYFTLGRGGAVTALAIVAATQYLELGLAKYVLIAYGANDWSRSRKGEKRGMPTREREGSWET